MTVSFDPSRFDPHDRSFLADPYPTYQRFREDAPVSRVRCLAPNQTVLYDSVWVFRYADCKAVLDGTELFLKNRQPPLESPGAFDVTRNLPNGLFTMDPPRHTLVRPILDGLFSRAIADMEQVASTLAKPLLQAAGAGSRFELLSSYAMPLPSRVLKTVLGIPDTHWGTVEQWVTMILAGHDYTAPLPTRFQGGTCSFALGGYFRALSRGCPVHADPGRMVDLMVTEAEGQGMEPDEVQQTALNLAVAGYLSTVFLLATGTLNLLRHPAQLAKLRADPALMEQAIEELLRFDAPAQLVDRFVAADTELCGVPLKAGTQVTAVLGSANRDPAVFEEPDRLDLTRDTQQHLGFGDGIHVCIGAPLVRKVAPVALQALFERFPNLSLAGLPQWQTDPYLRSVSNLPVAIG
ncbi:MAG: cytochrome P450 [Cyanobacteriota bacterium]